MSWDVTLIDENGNPVKVERHREGGTCVLGVTEGTAFVPGTADAELNVTFNYGGLYRKHFRPEGLEWIHEKKAKDVIVELEKAVKELGTKRSPDYWEPTMGNAGHALDVLLKWAKQYPEAVFTVVG